MGRRTRAPLGAAASSKMSSSLSCGLKGSVMVGAGGATDGGECALEGTEICRQVVGTEGKVRGGG